MGLLNKIFGKSYDDSTESLLKAAKQENADAQYELGWMYYRDGQHFKACQCFSEAIENGHPEARTTVIQLRLFFPGEEHYKNADQLFHDGLLYFFTSDLEQAFELISKAATQGHEKAKEALQDLFDGKEPKRHVPGEPF